MSDRIIKFRAWISEDGESPFMTYNLAFEEYGIINDQLNSVPTLMQFTGFKDKRGVEIYEGDILRNVNTGGITKVVWFKEGGCWSNPNLQDKNGRYSIVPETKEVIGNIYESPELLK